MSPIIRPANTDDIPSITDLLVREAEARCAIDPVLWTVAPDAAARTDHALKEALTAAHQPFRQIWQIAEQDGRIIGVLHAMCLPVPPIYAGRHGEPGLILPDSAVAPDAPDGTVDALVGSAEHALADAGASILLTAHVTGATWQDVFRARSYEPLTLYLSRADIGADIAPPDTETRPATEADVPGIVARSAEHRRVLARIDPFWETHPDADARFAAWMTKSLGLADRDMRVAGASPDLQGYIIAQPASRLHFPPTHDIAGTGVIDDFHHLDLADPAVTPRDGHGARALLRSAETAMAARGRRAAFVVCPAAWHSKAELLKDAGYGLAMVWSIKR
ncbi:hypothetical protein EKE94_17930 [Mesobaculum littorinae]|uniref:Uncharacterized protein n=1 Tax=Mesobaculum littorinae TaxID=2486419 RepID=A0A438AD90_9RHOB|nr:hypothetical protein [Mesobaculum littorinae]RVV96602.1 hypothetical protein EKE94_17930 [Mesobaculum littorinae]